MNKLLLLLVVALVLPGVSYAEVDPDNILNNIVDQYRGAVSTWEPIIRRHSMWLFWTLAFFEFAWMGIRLALKGADFQEFVSELVQRIMFVGFFAAVLLFSGEWIDAIISSFRQIADEATVAGGGTAGISPSAIFDRGLAIAWSITSEVGMNPFTNLGLMISSLVLMVCFALISAFLMLALIEMYIVTGAGIVLLGFGGSRFTKDFAVKYLTYAVSVGVKLLVMQLVVGIGEAIVSDWQTDVENNQGQTLILVGASIVILALVKSVPDIIQGIINGVSPGSGGAITAAAAAVGGAAIGAATGAVGGYQAVKEASKLAGVQGAASGGGSEGGISGAISSAFRGGGSGGGGGNGSSPSGGLAQRMAQVAGAYAKNPVASAVGGAVAHAGRTAANLSKAAAGDVAAKASGKNPGWGNMAGRMAASMKDERLSVNPAENPTPTANSEAGNNDGGTIEPGEGNSGS